MEGGASKGGEGGCLFRVQHSYLALLPPTYCTPTYRLHRSCYAMSGTDIVCAAPRSRVTWLCARKKL
eukprot:1188064-Rhodomonas_salina.1